MTPAQNTAAYIQGFEDGKRVAKAEIKRELEQRTWVGLTPQDYNEIFAKARSGEHAVQLAEAKLKEKNT